MEVLVYDEDDRRYVPLAVALLAAVLGVAIVGGLGYALGQEPQSEALSTVTEPQAATVPEPPACAAAVEQADAAFSLAAQLDAALAQHASVLNDLLGERVTRQELLDGAVAPLAVTTQDRVTFLNAVGAYEQARAACLE